MDFTRVRKSIDDLDSMIITLLAKRADLVSAAGRLKKNEGSVREPKRVEQVIERVRAKAVEKGLAPDIAEKAYRTITACFVDKEIRELSKEKRPVMQGTGGLK